MGLGGRRILIIDSEAILGPKLKQGFERECAEAILVPDPYSAKCAELIAASDYDAAVIHSAHRSRAQTIDVPAIVYGADTDVPALMDLVVSALKRMLRGR